MDRFFESEECNCGRDYLTVPLGEKCSNPMPARGELIVRGVARRTGVSVEAIREPLETGQGRTPRARARSRAIRECRYWGAGKVELADYFGTSMRSIARALEERRSF